MKLILKYLLFTCFLCCGINGSGQNHVENELVKEDGLIVFEGKGGFFEVYFIKTTNQQLNVLLDSQDTIFAVSVQTAFEGCVPMDAGDFKNSIDKSKTFDSLSLLISQKNHLDQAYEDSTNLYFKWGSVTFRRNTGRQLPTTSYKEIHYHSKITVIAINSVIPIDKFTYRKTSMRLQKRN